jgi:hypothetical protein
MLAPSVPKQKFQIMYKTDLQKKLKIGSKFFKTYEKNGKKFHCGWDGVWVVGRIPVLCTAYCSQ